jgi:hypothetical protein
MKSNEHEIQIVKEFQEKYKRLPFLTKQEAEEAGMTALTTETEPDSGFARSVIKDLSPLSPLKWAMVPWSRTQIEFWRVITPYASFSERYITGIAHKLKI